MWEPAIESRPPRKKKHAPRNLSTTDEAAILVRVRSLTQAVIEIRSVDEDRCSGRPIVIEQVELRVNVCESVRNRFHADAN